MVSLLQYFFTRLSRYLKGTAIFILLLSPIFSAQCDRLPHALEQIIEREALNIAIVYGPDTYHITASGPSGFHYELAAGLASYIGVDIVVTPYDNYAEMTTALENGAVDIAITGKGLTQSVLSQGRFGPYVQKIKQLVIAHRDTQCTLEKTNTASSLFYAADSAVIAPDLASLNSADPVAVHNADQAELLEGVVRHDYPLVAINSNTWAMLHSRFPQLCVAATSTHSLPVAWQLAKNKDPSFLAALFEYVSSIRQDGTLESLIKRYFAVSSLPPKARREAFIVDTHANLFTLKDQFEALPLSQPWVVVAAAHYTLHGWDDPAEFATTAKRLTDLAAHIPARIDENNRWKMSLAALYSGLAHLEDARALTRQQGGDPDVWLDVKQRYPFLRLKKYYQQASAGYVRGDDTLAFVNIVEDYHDILIALEAEQNQVQSGSNDD